jgi:hypothetical protein
VNGWATNDERGGRSGRDGERGRRDGRKRSRRPSRRCRYSVVFTLRLTRPSLTQSVYHGHRGILMNPRSTAEQRVVRSPSSASRSFALTSFSPLPQNAHQQMARLEEGRYQYNEVGRLTNTGVRRFCCRFSSTSRRLTSLSRLQHRFIALLRPLLPLRLRVRSAAARPPLSSSGPRQQPLFLPLPASPALLLLLPILSRQLHGRPVLFERVSARPPGADGDEGAGVAPDVWEGAGGLDDYRDEEVGGRVEGAVRRSEGRW